MKVEKLALARTYQPAVRSAKVPFHVPGKWVAFAGGFIPDCMSFP